MLNGSAGNGRRACLSNAYRTSGDEAKGGNNDAGSKRRRVGRRDPMAGRIGQATEAGAVIAHHMCAAADLLMTMAGMRHRARRKAQQQHRQRGA